MIDALGEYECKIDAKGRLRIPTELLSSLGKNEDLFVINRGFENCLNLHTKKDWEQVRQKVDALNPFVIAHRKFQRFFYRGATEVKLDTSGRILIKKALLEYGKIEKEAIMAVVQDRIEIWSKTKYLEFMNEDPDDFSDMAQDIFMGKSPEE